MQLEPLKALSHTCWWLISFCVCVSVCVHACACMHVRVCEWSLSNYFLSAFVFPSTFPTVFSNCLKRLQLLFQPPHVRPDFEPASIKTPQSWHTRTHAHSFLPDVTQCAHIPVLPHLSQQLWACVRVCLCGFTNTWRPKQSNLRHRHQFMWRLELSASVRPIPLCISILEMSLKLHMGKLLCFKLCIACILNEAKEKTLCFLAVLATNNNMITDNSLNKTTAWVILYDSVILSPFILFTRHTVQG